MISPPSASILGVETSVFCPLRLSLNIISRRFMEVPSVVLFHCISIPLRVCIIKVKLKLSLVCYAKFHEGVWRSRDITP
jgi:hypothetical protein